MGYGSRALSQLQDFFSGKLVNLDEMQTEVGGEDFKTVAKYDKVSIIYPGMVSICFCS